MLPPLQPSPLLAGFESVAVEAPTPLPEATPSPLPSPSPSPTPVPLVANSYVDGDFSLQWRVFADSITFTVAMRAVGVPSAALGV
jgi:hypothetical protein